MIYYDMTSMIQCLEFYLTTCVYVCMFVFRFKSTIIKKSTKRVDQAFWQVPFYFGVIRVYPTGCNHEVYNFFSLSSFSNVIWEFKDVDGFYSKIRVIFK